MLRLLGLYLKIGALNEMEYRVNFLFQVLYSVLNLVAALAQLGIIFSLTDSLNGWRAPELLALLGVYFLVGGVIRMVIAPSMQRFMEDIRQGTLDFTLTKPEDSQVLVSVKQIEVWKLIDVMLGAVLIAVSLSQLGTAIGPVEAAAFLVALLAGGAMVYSLFLILSTFTFWFVRIENILVIFLAMWEAGRWPVGIYPGWLRVTLTFVVPVAFATTVPAEALTGRLTAQTLALAVALGVALLLISRRFWTVGVRHYSGASA